MGDRIIAVGLIEHMGDIVACEPVARYLREKYPEDHIVWCVREPYRELIDTNPYIDETIIVNCLTEWVFMSQGGVFDEVIDLHINRRVCPDCGLPVEKTKGNSNVDEARYFDYGSLLTAFSQGAGLPPLDMPPKIYIPESVAKKIDALQLVPTEKFVVVHTTSNETSKDWLPQKWMELVERVTNELNVCVVEVGTKGLLNNFGIKNYIDLSGQLSILETAEVIRRASIFIGVDSGPAHLANAVGTHGAILLGHYRNFRHYNPYTGDYGTGKNADLIYEDGPPSNIPVEKVFKPVAGYLTSNVDTMRVHDDALIRLQIKEPEEKSARLIAFYLPQFHPIPENDKWWGKGFTEWANVVKAKPLFPSHYQPHLPADLGFYDLRVPETRVEQAALAREYGIEGFCYWHYWFNGKLLLDRPFREVLDSGIPDFPFCLAWANENWTRRWDGQADEILQAQTYGGEEDSIRHFNWLLRAFKDHRYIKVDSKPIFLIYRPFDLPDPSKTVSLWRKLASEAGLPGLYLIAMRTGFDVASVNWIEKGFDAVLNYQPNFRILVDYINAQRRSGNGSTTAQQPLDAYIIDYETAWRLLSSDSRVSGDIYDSVFPSWDNTARRMNSTPFIIANSSPYEYEKWLKFEIDKMSDRSPEHRVVFLNAWNEWAEGNHLEPDIRFGRTYLEVTRQAVLSDNKKVEFFKIYDGIGAVDDSLPLLQIADSLLESVKNRKYRFGHNSLSMNLRKALRLHARMMASHHHEIMRLMREGRKAQAFELNNKLNNLISKNSEAHNAIGFLYFQNNLVDNALFHFETAAALDNSNTVAQKNLADIYLQIGNFEKGLKIYQNILAKDTTDIEAMLSLGKACLILDRKEDAAFFFKRILELQPGNVEVQKMLDAISAKSDGRSSERTEIGVTDTVAPTQIRNLSSTPLVSIIIPVYNKLDFTRRCVESILSNIDNLNYEILVVDNGSTDGTRDYLQSTKSIRLRFVLNEQNLGFVDGCNSGAAIAHGDYLLFLNNDTEVTPGWIGALVNFAESTPDCGIVGTKLVYPDGRLQEAGGIIFSDGNGWNYGRGDDPHDPKYNFVREVDYVSGAALMIKRKLWDDIGGFDRRYAPAYYEDTDLCFEARKRGYKVYYQPKSTVIHYEGQTAGTNLLSGYKKYQLVNRDKFLAKWSTELSNQQPNDPRNVVLASSRGTKGNIMVFDPFLPLFDRASGSLRLFHILRILRRMNYHVTFIARDGSLEQTYHPVLESMSIEVHSWDRDAMRAAGNVTDSLLAIDFHRLFAERRYEYVIIDFWYLAEYYLPIVRRLSPNSQIIIDTIDIHFIRELREAELSKDKNKKRSALLNKGREISIYKKADRIWVVTANDRNAIAEYVKDLPIDIIPNVHDKVDQTKDFKDTSDLLFVGNFNHQPNRDAMRFFCKDVFPLISKELPDVKLYIVGNDPPDEVKSLSSDKIVVTGYVRDISPYQRTARVSVAPLRYGAGMKGKIGEALSWGLPVVTTSIGAEGMNLVHEQDVLIADNPNSFAREVLRLYSDKELWNRLSKNGRQKVESMWSPEVVKNQLEKALPKQTPSLSRKLASIVILTYNNLQYTKLCLASIEANTNYPHEVIIVDNASTDGTVEFLKQISAINPKYKVILNHANFGFPAGCNQGIEAAKGNYIILLNNDTVVTKDWLDGLIECAESVESIGIVGPMINYVSGFQREAYAAFSSIDSLQKFAAKYRNRKRRQWTEVPRIAGTAMLIKRKLVETIGGLDPTFGVGNCEDDDYSLRSLYAGFKNVIAGDVFIHHYGGKSFLVNGNHHAYIEIIEKNSSIFAEKWGITPTEWWKEGKSPTKVSPLYIPFAAKESIPA